MAKFRVLSGKDIEQVLTLPMAMEAVERAYLQKETGKGQVWPMVFHEFDPGHADLDIKSGNLDENGIFGLKVVSWYGANPEKGLPALFGTSLIFDLSTGMPRAVLNAEGVTGYRTGAAGAIGAKYLARPDSQKLLMVGCGTIAPYLIAATLLAMPQLRQVTVADPKFPGNAAQRLGAVTDKVDHLLEQGGAKRSAELLAADDMEAAVRASDIILTATPSYEPLIRSEWVQPGTHLSCIGADMSGKQEVESALFARARVFGDDRAQCLSVGECEKPHKEGVLTDLNGEIGQVIAGTVPGRTTPEDVTVFDSTGIALQDLAAAAAILERAEQAGLGTAVEL